MRTLNYVLIALMLSLGYSCENEALDDKNQEDLEQEVVYEVIDITDPVYQSILSQGFKAEDILADEDFYIVEGDILFSKSAIIEPQSNEKGVKHARTTNIVSYSKRSIGVFLNLTTFTSAELRDNLDLAMDQVLEAYNGVCGCYLNFYRGTYLTSRINIYEETLGVGVCGEGGFPTSQGVPGGIIRLNESVISNFSVSQLTFLLAHELGHNIGLRHTDWNSTENAEPYGAIHIPYTPDANSVMNMATCSFEWDGLTAGDEEAIYRIYNGLIGYMEGPYALDCEGWGTWSIDVEKPSDDINYAWYYKMPETNVWTRAIDVNGDPVGPFGFLPVLNDDTFSKQFIIDDYDLLQLKVEVSDNCRTYETIYDVWGNCGGGVLP
ncbi:M57 family metalloprotease [Labilibaculum euxinus]